jgi:hypothetical protein
MDESLFASLGRLQRDAGVCDGDSMVRHEINGNSLFFNLLIFSDSSNRYSEGGIKSCARRRRSDCVRV